MPTYDYRCERCGHEFEEFQSITAAPLKKCPACGQRALERLIGTGGGIIFKGSGFYQTDYRSASYRKAADADKPATVTNSSKDSPAKPAEKPATKPTEKRPAKSKPTPAAAAG